MNTVYLTRLVIETQSPMAINTGGRETGVSTQLARDANGLPYIPATSIAGVWRHLLASSQADFWFGDSAQNNDSAKSSLLTIADGVLLDSESKPVQGLIGPDRIAKDPILSLLVLVQPHLRERVRINDRGVAADQAKFEQLLIPKGTRFVVDIRFNDNRGALTAEHLAQWQTLLDCWHSRFFTLGATTRNGLGQINVIASSQQTLKLGNNVGAAGILRAFNRREVIPTSGGFNRQDQPFAQLPLKALDNWRCGKGSTLLGKSDLDHPVKQFSYSEAEIQWTSQGASVSNPRPLLCGSSIKGILAHRICYHLRRHLGQWAEDMDTADHQQWQKRPAEVQVLLGLADDEQPTNSVAGCLFVDDCEIHDAEALVRPHTSIDRFTGGVRSGALYSEELLYQPAFTLKLWLAPNAQLSTAVIAALTDTLDDLKLGLLPFGAGSGRGSSLVKHDETKSWVIDNEVLNRALTNANLPSNQSQSHSSER